jgi:methylenetetrahydrofolate reductase (NADPH)
MSQPAQATAAGVAAATLAEAIARLARTASIEINVHDAAQMQAARAFLAPGTRIYVSFLPKQDWDDTLAAARAVRAAGFEPVPHVPVRRVSDAATLERNLGRLVEESQVRELLLISGDYREAQGPYSTVLQVMQSGLLARHGICKLSVAGHPEGHPAVALEVIRQAERDKAALGAEQGLDLALLTQVVFEHAPLRQWAAGLRASGVRARLVAGLAGPASITTLFKFAVRCGAGPSIRALGVRPGSLLKLLGDRGPEEVVRGLAAAQASGAADLDAIHLFCFGGFLRSAEWLHRVANGQFQLDDKASFRV